MVYRLELAETPNVFIRGERLFVATFVRTWMEPPRVPILTNVAAFNSRESD
jgi:hypothetical protein